MFRSNAKEALQKAQEASGSEDLKIKDQAVTWEVLEGDVEMETMKKIIESQQESLNKRKGGKGISHWRYFSIILHLSSKLHDTYRDCVHTT